MKIGVGLIENAHSDMLCYPIPDPFCRQEVQILFISYVFFFVVLFSVRAVRTLFLFFLGGNS